MPALRLFGRRWMLASDDIPVPAFVFFAFHTVWCGLLGHWLVSLRLYSPCAAVDRATGSAAALLGSFATSAALELAACCVGLRGSIFELRQRRAMPALLYGACAAWVASTAALLYATVLVATWPDGPACEADEEAAELLGFVAGMRAPSSSPSSSHPSRSVLSAPSAASALSLLQALVWSTWAVVGLLAAAGLLAYNSFPDYDRPSSWQARFACWARLCCCNRDRRARNRELGERLGRTAVLLFGHVDMTTSDVVVACLLALVEQKILRREARLVAQGRCGLEVGVELLRSDEHLDPQGVSNERGEGGRGGGATGATYSTVHSQAAFVDLEAGYPQGGAVELVRISAEGEGGGMQGFGPSVRSSLSPSPPPLSLPPCPTLNPPPSLLPPPLAPLPLSRAPLADAETLAEAAHWMRYAFAAYGYLLYVWHRPATGLFELCCARPAALGSHLLRPPGAGLGTPSARPRRRVVAALNREATLKAAGLEDENLIFVRYEAEVHDVLPYFLALDRAKGVVVLAIRGSMSLDDVVRDMLFEPVGLDEWSGLLPQEERGGAEDESHVEERAESRAFSRSSPASFSRGAWTAPLPELRPASASTQAAGHSGIAEAARATVADLQERGDLQRLLEPEAQARHGCSGLVVTGHSLGAGCAFLVSLFLRRAFPELRCWAFSPPGGLASASLARRARSRDWCTAVVCGHEWVPRLTVASCERARDAVVGAAIRCKRHKLRLLLGVLTRRAWTRRELFHPGAAPDLAAAEAWASYRASLQRAAGGGGAFVAQAREFGLPGRVLYLQPLSGREAEWGGDEAEEVEGGGRRARWEGAGGEARRDEAGNEDEQRRDEVGGRDEQRRRETLEAKVSPPPPHTPATSSSSNPTSSLASAASRAALVAKPPETARTLSLWPAKKRSRVYRAVWVDAEAFSRQGVIFSGRMMADHMPEYLLAALNRLAGARARQARAAEVQDDAGQGVRPVLDGEERTGPGREAEV